MHRAPDTHPEPATSPAGVAPREPICPVPPTRKSSESGRGFPGPLTTALALGAITLGAVGCATAGSRTSTQGGAAGSELATVPEVDLDRFMGHWHVLALIPNLVEKNPYQSVETYRMRPDGKIDVTYHYRKGGFDAKKKELNMVAWPIDDTGSHWKVRPFWPLKLDYRIIDLADDYRYTVVGHPSRNYVWIMARGTSLPEADWQGIMSRLDARGFDLDEIERVPQVPPLD